MCIVQNVLAFCKRSMSSSFVLNMKRTYDQKHEAEQSPFLPLVGGLVELIASSTLHFHVYVWIWYLVLKFLQIAQFFSKIWNNMKNWRQHFPHSSSAFYSCSHVNYLTYFFPCSTDNISGSYNSTLSPKRLKIDTLLHWHCGLWTHCSIDTFLDWRIDRWRRCSFDILIDGHITRSKHCLSNTFLVRKVQLEKNNIKVTLKF